MATFSHIEIVTDFSIGLGNMVKVSIYTRNSIYVGCFNFLLSLACASCKSSKLNSMLDLANLNQHEQVMVLAQLFLLCIFFGSFTD